MMKIAQALAPLCAATLGVLIYVQWLSIWVAAAMIVLGLSTWLLSWIFLTRKIVVIAVVISMWIFAGVGLMALATAGLLWITLHVPQLFPNLPADTVKEICAVITGALTTFLGVAITKDMEQGGGFFWPGGLFRRLVRSAFSAEPHKLSDTYSGAYSSAFDDRVQTGGAQGWGFVARIKRANVLQAWLAHTKKPPDQPPPQ